jgi:hypothetical protein
MDGRSSHDRGFLIARTRTDRGPRTTSLSQSSHASFSRRSMRTTISVGMSSMTLVVSWPMHMRSLPRIAKLLASLRADPALASIVDAFEVGKGQPGRKFGSNGLKVNGKHFALFTQGTLVVKLPKDRVAELVASVERGALASWTRRPIDGLKPDLHYCVNEYPDRFPFARYIALSAFAISVSAVFPSFGQIAIPMLTLTMRSTTSPCTMTSDGA